MECQQNPDEIRNHVLTENTAQSVRNRLRELISNRTHVSTRWIWELLQNARDASAQSDTRLVVSIEQAQGRLVFRHNGAKFKIEEITHLIYHGSTKIERPDTIGQYGSGFLTTHLLSPEIDVSGQLNDGRQFEFRLKREIDSVSQLSNSMERAWSDFKDSLQDVPTEDDFTTEFQYSLGNDAEALKVAEEGIATLKLCAPFVVAFNQEFDRIDIKSPGETMTFKVTSRSHLEQEGLHRVTVGEVENQNYRETEYVLAQGEKAAVVTPIESFGDSSGCLSVNEIPRLFLGFPLIGTEQFSFPAIINSLSFTPSENRDGVYLAQSDSEENIQNQLIIEEACELLVRLLGFAAKSGWYNAYELARIPPIVEGKYWLNENWLREKILKQLICKIRQTPAVLNKDGKAISPADSSLPLAETASVESLWDLWEGWKGGHEGLTRRHEASGWCDSVKSWAGVYKEDDPESLFNEVITGRRLASRVEKESEEPSSNPTRRSLSCLKSALKQGISGIQWLDQILSFLRDNESDEALNEYSIVLSQEGHLCYLSDLHPDRGIDEELKDIADLLGWHIRSELRDTQLTSLAEENSARGWDNEDVVSELIKKLQARATKKPDGTFAKACVSLFSWIVRQDESEWKHLRGFPVFTRVANSDSVTVRYLPRNAHDNEQLLAPVGTWTKDLQQFSDLFPSTRILADEFFKAVPSLDTWRMLDKTSLVRTSIVFTNSLHFDRFYPDYPLRDGVSHRTAGPVTVTDILDRAEIMERVRDSRTRAALFWKFLTEWLVKKDTRGLNVEEAECECGESHHYFPAAWLVPLRENNWIRLRNSDVRDYAKAQPLADLFRDNGWNPTFLIRNPSTVRLLEAISVAHFDLLRAFVVTNDEERKAQDDAFTEILVATGGDLSLVREFVQDIENDEGILEHLAKRREQMRVVHENQCLGQNVEDLVKESLESQGFAVRRTGVGSDFEISVETDEVARLRLTRGNQSWLVEVKATRAQSQGVRMTATQAETAVEKGDRFLLCVVPVDRYSDLELDNVRAQMRFVKDIGTRVGSLCNDLGAFEELRDEITAEESLGVQLKIDPGAARIRVARSVWENDGFGLEELVERLAA